MHVMALSRAEKETIIKGFAVSSQDTGSSEVQIALLTEKIRQLTNHCQANPKDFSTKRGLLKLVCSRRRFLSYLEQKDAAKYREIIKRLGLRK
jgi:small subunit ribosomal protein S15